MPSITNVGGSLTSAAILTLLAWGVRIFRAAAQRKRLQAEQNASEPPYLGRFFCLLSPASLNMLLRTRAFPFTVADVRTTAESEAAPLPEELHDALHVPGQWGCAVQELQASLQQGTLTSPRDKRKPTRQELLCLVGKDAAQMRAGAAAAAAGGHNLVAILEGGLAGFESADLAQAPAKRVSAHALALLLGLGSAPVVREPVCCIDVRRADERTLYGCIPGSLHIPLEQLPHALQAAPQAFEEAYGQPQPLRAHGWLVVVSRREGRAAWAAQLAHDAGFRQTLLLQQGVSGWRLHASVQPYEKYADGEPPPDPDPFQVEALDEAWGREELVRLGVLPRDSGSVRR